jgi:hypothetical protein
MTRAQPEENEIEASGMQPDFDFVGAAQGITAFAHLAAIIVVAVAVVVVVVVVVFVVVVIDYPTTITNATTTVFVV